MATLSTPAKQSPEERVRSANQRFYAAFESLDMAEMEAAWAHDDNVECVQPGGELLLGGLYRARYHRFHRWFRRSRNTGDEHFCAHRERLAPGCPSRVAASSTHKLHSSIAVLLFNDIKARSLKINFDSALLVGISFE